MALGIHDLSLSYISKEAIEPASVALKASAINTASSGVSPSPLCSFAASRFHTCPGFGPPSFSHGNGRRLSGSRLFCCLLDGVADAVGKFGPVVSPPVLVGEPGADVLRFRGEKRVDPPEYTGASGGSDPRNVSFAACFFGV